MMVFKRLILYAVKGDSFPSCIFIFKKSFFSIICKQKKTKKRWYCIILRKKNRWLGNIRLRKKYEFHQVKNKFCQVKLSCSKSYVIHEIDTLKGYELANCLFLMYPILYKEVKWCLWNIINNIASIANSNKSCEQKIIGNLREITLEWQVNS